VENPGDIFIGVFYWVLGNDIGRGEKFFVPTCATKNIVSKQFLSLSTVCNKKTITTWTAN